ncbi:MAG TPA: flagellar basal body-associated FliL family protein [Planctomycetota bacterium]|nr:flagellar basal body-associated FliL family protein [Planctomycetota bacterium]
MNKKLLLVGVGVVLASGAAFMAAGAAKPAAAEVDWRSRRGKDEYYLPEEHEFDLPDINVNLKGTGGQRYLAAGLGVRFRIGQELALTPNKDGTPHDPKSSFEKAKLEIKDRLTILLSNKSVNDLEGSEKKKALKQEILEELSVAVFPDQLGRIEQVYIKQLLVQ